MKSFLDHIWKDSDGFRCLTVRRGEHINNLFWVNNENPNSAAIELGVSHDVWYAPAIFNSEKRGTDNVKEVRALWLDIDVKDGNYQSIESALSALFDFAKHLTSYVPAVVNSGNGIHVYWILRDETFAPVEWLEYANGLREACIEFGLKADHSITIDIARILRVPGTKNFKDKSNPKDVVLGFTPINTLTKAELYSGLAPYILKVKQRQEAKEFNKLFAVEIPQTPKDAELIAAKCPQMALFKESKGNLPEPQWYAGLGILALCENGEQFAHDWSKGHPKYRKKETQSKFERAVEFAPTTCARFEACSPDICRACPMLGKITSPIQLGEKVTPVEIVIDRPLEENKESQESLPVPRYYEVGKEGVYTKETEDASRKMILSQPLWVSRVMVAEHGAGSEVEVIWLNANHKRRTAAFKHHLLAQDASFAAWLLDNNIHGFNSIKSVVTYIRAGISTVARMYEEETVYNKFGLCDAGFVIGQDLITKDGRRTARISEEIDRRKVKFLDVRGTAAEWSEASKLLDRPEWWMHRFAILAALGSPLLGLSGSEGSVLSLAGESSGGKTTSANFGASAYGDFRAFTVDPQSTLNAFYEHWRIAGQLPVVCNEAATINAYHLKEIVYAAANGKARDRLTRAGKMKDSGGWQTLTIFTSNTHLLALSDKILSEATRRRILELSFDVENKLPLTVGMELNRVMKHHHGEIGRLFLDGVISNGAAVGTQVRERVEKLQQGIDSVHRYNIWLIAVCAVTAEIASGLGLIRFKTDDAINNAIEVLKNQDKTHVRTVERVDDAIARYANEFQMQIGSKVLGHNGVWVTEPRGEAKGRYDVNQSGEATDFYLPIGLFKEWAIERNLDINQIKQYVRESGIETKNQRISRHGKPLACYRIPQQNEAEN